MTRHTPFGAFSCFVALCMALILVTQRFRDNQRSVPIPVMDLNADIGEHDGDGYLRDAALMDLASSVNIACAGHAGSPEVMRRTVALARERGLSIGAHPGYPDREGFGRRELQLPVDAIVRAYVSQLHRMAESCEKEGARMAYVKPHGALYNRAAGDPDLAERMATATTAFDSSLAVLTLPGCALASAAALHGLTVAREAFVDRAYRPDGTLVPRDRPGAIIEDPASAARRAVRIALGRSVEAIDGSELAVEADSLCVHGDGANALVVMKAARAELERSGFRIGPFAS